MNILFICSRNKWRSRTAEVIFQKYQHLDVRSAGTSKEAEVRVSEKLINWAEVIFVMEKEHNKRLEEKFRDILHTKRIYILDIPDEYQFMDEELIEILETTVGHYLNRL